MLGTTKLDGVYWTLLYELKFYVFVGLLIWRQQLNKIDYWLTGWLIATALSPLCPVWISSLTLAPWSAFFIAGCNLFLLWSRGWDRWRVLGLTGAFALSIIAGMNSQESAGDVPSDTMQALAVIVICTALFTLALRLWRLPRSALWRLLGSFTFPLYLIHSRPAKALWTSLDLPDNQRLLIVWAATFAVAGILAITIERGTCSRLNRAVLRIMKPKAVPRAALPSD